jgi:1-deoxy-D-xylulose-5-phosphate reductoisomerase
MEVGMTTPRGAKSRARSVTILGSTGSVGCNTVELIADGLAADPGSYVVEALTANGNVAMLIEQARRLRPRFVAVADPARYGELADGLAGTGIAVAAGRQAVVEAAEHPADWVMAAIVGAAGLEPTLAAIRRGATVGLANKECLVCAGDLVMAAARTHGATLLPVDSEHSAIFQVFDFQRPETVDRLILTASGGPFRRRSLADMANVTPAEAVAHPNWDMGAKISVDSATMMNKGLEVIEACHLFPVPEGRIEVLVHPQSVIHSLVAYVDGSTLAQLGTPDMRTPIAVALAWPGRIPVSGVRLDLVQVRELTFEEPDHGRFPALRLAREALRRGGSDPTVLNAANEVAVQAFLAGQVGFLEIATIVERTLAGLVNRPLASLDDVRESDAEARRLALSFTRMAAAAD